MLQRHLVLVFSRGGLHRLPLDQECHSQARGRARPAPADPERDEAAFDGEVAAGQLADRPVLPGHRIARGGSMRVDHARRVASHVALIGGNGGFVDGSTAEGRAFDLPAVVSSLVPVFKNNVGPARWLRGRLSGGAEQRSQARLAENAIAQETVLRAVVQANAIFHFAGKGGRDR